MCPAIRLAGVVCLFVLLSLATLTGQPPTKPNDKAEQTAKAKQLRKEAKAAIRKGDRPTAIEKLDQAYEIERKAHGDEYRTLWSTLSKIAGLYREMDDFEGAAKANDKLAEYLARRYGPTQRFALREKWNADYDRKKAKLTPKQRTVLRDLQAQASRAFRMRSNGDNRGAAALLGEVVEKRQKLVGWDTPDNADELFWLGTMLRDCGKLEEAIVPYQKSLELHTQRYGNKVSRSVVSRWNLGQVYKRLDRAELALKHMLPALESAKKLEQKNLMRSASILTMLRVLGIFLTDEGRPDEAIRMFAEARQRLEKAKHAKTLDYVLVLTGLVRGHALRYELRKAKQLIDEAIPLCAEVTGTKHGQYGRCLRLRGQVEYQLGLYRNAEKSLLQATELAEPGGKEEYEYVEAQNMLGLVYLDWGFPRQAKPIFERNRAIYLRLGKKTNEAAMHHNLGLAYRAFGDFVEAERAFSEALRLKQEVRGKEHIDCAVTLDQLGALYEECGDFTRAEKKFLEAQRIRQKAAGDDSVVMLPSLHELGMFYLQTRDFARAEEFLTKAVKLRRKYQGEKHPAYAKSLDNLAKFYHRTKNYGKAETHLSKALAIREAVLSQSHPDIATGLHNLADLYVSRAMFEKALPMFERAEAIVEKTEGADHPRRAKILLQVAWCKSQLGRADEARKIAENTLALLESYRRRSPTKRPHPYQSECLLHLATWAADRKEYKTALGYLDLAATIAEEAYGKGHFESAAILVERGRTLARMGKTSEAFGALDAALEIQYRTLGNVFSFAGEEMMEAYLFGTKLTFEKLVSIALLRDELPEKERRLVYKWALRRKGLVLETRCRYRQASAVLARDERIASLTRQLRGAQRELIDIVIAPPREWSKEKLESVVARTREQIETNESKLNRRLSAHSGSWQPEKNSIDTLATRLARGTLLVEFVRFASFDPESASTERKSREEKYLAIVLSSKGSLTVVEVGFADEIDEAVAELRDNLGKTEKALASASEKFLEGIYRKVAERTYRTLLGPLEEHLEGANRLVLVPDGSLHRVPFAALVHPEDKKYLIERMPIVYLSSGRDLLRPKRPLGKGVVVFAGPDFDLSVKKRADLVEKLPKIPSGLVLRGPVLRDGVKAWDRLEGAEAEADDIKKATESGKLGPVTIYKGADAVEERLADLRSPRVLHFATHGFYYQHEQRGGPNQEDIGLRTRLRGESEALFRSGIVLAGANVKLKKDDKRVEDGWLTAAEAALLDLSGTELVVLSACEAGLGDIKGSEGVYGLRRALFYAGARSIATTLFSVRDAETRLLMKGFYTELAKGTPKGEALHKAQVELIRSRRAKTKAAHPLFWAGFVLIGEVKLDAR